LHGERKGTRRVKHLKRGVDLFWKESNAMILELARPVALLGCILSLLGVFRAAFLEPGSDVEQRITGSLGPLLLAVGIALAGGLIFQAGSHDRAGHSTSLIDAFPMRVFLWSIAGMLLLFLLSWYLEAHCIFYRDLRF